MSLLRNWQKQVALVCIYALVVAFYASVVFFTSSLRNETASVLTTLPPLWIQQLKGGRLVPMSTSLQDSIASIKGVKKIYPRYWGYFFDDATGAVLTVMGSKVPSEDMKYLTIVQSAFEDSSSMNTCIVGTGILEIRQLEIGDFLTLNDANGDKVSYQIRGIFTSESDLLTRDLIILPIQEAQKIIGLADSLCTDMALEVFNEEEIQTIAKKIDARYPSLRVVERSQLASTYESLFSWRGGIFVYGSILSVLAFLLLMWERASALSGNERKELGILKAIGWQINDVLFLKLIEGAILSISSTLIGLLLAYLHIFIIHSPLLKPFLIGWSVLYPSYNLLPVIRLGDILSIFFLSVVPYLAVTLFPAWKGASTEAVDAMR